MESYVDLLDKVSAAKQTIFSKVNNLEGGWVKELVELWQYELVDEKPELFDPPGLVHVGQGSRGYDGSVKGNCYNYHLEIGENPCTSLKTCQLRDLFRDAQDDEAEKVNQQKKISEKEKARVKRYNNDQKRFDEWCDGMEWGAY